MNHHQLKISEAPFQWFIHDKNAGCKMSAKWKQVGCEKMRSLAVILKSAMTFVEVRGYVLCFS